jgi:hypothetical protein
MYFTLTVLNAGEGAYLIRSAKPFRLFNDVQGTIFSFIIDSTDVLAHHTKDEKCKTTEQELNHNQ